MTEAPDETRAVDFVSRMDTDRWSAADEHALQEWLAADPLRQGLLLRTHAAWLATDPALHDPAQPAEPAAPTARHYARRGVLGGIGAMAAALGALLLVRPARAPGAAFSTRLGEIRKVPLADGSVMQMNSASAVEVSLEQTRRGIQLTSGEVWFKVAKDAERPFVVTAGHIHTEAIGTAFSVRMHDNAVEVLVTEGVVETWSERDAQQRLRLTAGQRATMSEFLAVRYASAESQSVDRALAWRNRMIDLNSTPLSEAAAEFNRYNRRQIVVEDPAIASEQFDGVFRVDNPEGFAEAVRNSLDVAVRLDDPDVIRITRRSDAAGAAP